MSAVILGSMPSRRTWLYHACVLLLLIWGLRFVFVHFGSEQTTEGVASSDKLRSKPSIDTTFKKLAHTFNSQPENQESGPASVHSSEKVAVIVETRQSPNIIPLIIHFTSVLGPEWPILIYTSRENVGFFSNSAPLLRHRNTGFITVRALAEGLFVSNLISNSKFFTNPWFWEDLAPAEHILLFQADSMLCGNAARSVEDYLDYDFIGAPIAEHLGTGYSGGFSLRKRSTMLRILDEWIWAETDIPRSEDQWFYSRLLELQERDAAAGDEQGVSLPEMDVARTFAVESIYYPTPLGLHQPANFLNANMSSLNLWCPEYKLAIRQPIK